MNKETIFLIDIISILPDKVDCDIQAPSLEDEMIFKMLSDGGGTIKLDDTNKDLFLNRIKNHSIVDEFHKIEIKFNGKLLFEGFDGVEYGSISNTISLPDWFKEKYIEDEDYFISDGW